jgi:hypothetical protein
MAGPPANYYPSYDMTPHSYQLHHSVYPGPPYQGVAPHPMAPIMYSSYDMNHIQQLLTHQTPVVYTTLEPSSQSMSYYPSPIAFMDSIPNVEYSAH